MSYLKRFKDRVASGSVGSVGTYPQTSEKSQGAQSDTEVQYNNNIRYNNNYIQNNHIRTCTNSHSEKSTDSWGNQTTEPTKPHSVGFVGAQPMPWPPRPAELSGWSIERRQRWGELANQLSDKGVMFPESERQAFMQVKAEG
jgi:hypothetical protein